MNVSSVKNLNGEVFSAVQDASLTNVIQTNSGNWQDITAYQNNSASYQPSGNYIPYTAVDISNTAFKTNSGLSIDRFGEGGLNSTLLSPNTIQMYFVASPTSYMGSILAKSSLKFETQSDSAYVDKEKIHTWDSASDYIQNISANWADVSTTVQTNSAQWAEEVISSYTTATIEGTNAINSLNGKPLISFRTQSAQEAGNAKYANSAYYDIYGHNLAQNYFDITALSARLTANSGNWNEISAYQTNSATYLTAHQAISAEEWNNCYNNVNTNSGAWGGSALPISAGPGVKLQLVDNTLVVRTLLSAGQGINVTTSNNSLAVSTVPSAFYTLNISNIILTASLPGTPDANTLYLIQE